VALLVLQGWVVLGVRSDLAELRNRLEQAQSSVGQVWESAKGLDQDRMGRLGLLADSIRLVFDYAQGQIQQWETNYANLAQRLDENDQARAAVNTRLDGLARADQVHRSWLDALERQDRTQSVAFEALVRRAQTQEASTNDVSVTIASLRGTLGRMDDALAALERRYTAASSRVESLSGWAEGFRRVGLSADAVQGQFSALSNELRRIRIRVDSLRPVRRATSPYSR
jgi:chromosome segregation ATPase